MRVVSHASLSEPDRPRNPEFEQKDILVVLARQPRIAHLDGGEEPLLGHEQCSLTIRVEAASLKDQSLPPVGPEWGAPRGIRRGGDELAHSRVAGIIVVLRPGVEAPVAPLEPAVAQHARGRRVAQPNPVGQTVAQPVSGGVHAVRVETVPCALSSGLIVAKNFDALTAVQYADDLGVDPRNRVELAWPIGLMMRPGDPCGVVTLPLGGKAICGHPSQRFRIGP